MIIKNVSEKKIKEAIHMAIGKHLDIENHRLFFFGSRVSGSGNERSDIDVGIEGPGPVPRIIMAKIEDEIEGLPFLYKIEVVDFCRVSKKFREVAMQSIEPIR